MNSGVLPGQLFSQDEVRAIGQFANFIANYGSAIIEFTDITLRNQAVARLDQFAKDHPDLLNRLDELARREQWVSPKLVISEKKAAASVAGLLTAAKRCLDAVSFLGHCICVNQSPGGPPGGNTPREIEQEAHPAHMSLAHARRT